MNENLMDQRKDTVSLFKDIEGQLNIPSLYIIYLPIPPLGQDITQGHF